MATRTHSNSSNRNSWLRKGDDADGSTCSSGQSVRSKIKVNPGEKPSKPNEGKSSKSASFERRSITSKEAELQQVLEELAKVKARLFTATKNNKRKLQEFSQNKQLVEDLTSKLHEATEASAKDKLRAEEMEKTINTVEEEWKVQVESVKWQYERELASFENTRQEVEYLKAELEASVEDKEKYKRMFEDAEIALEEMVSKANELSEELASVRASVYSTDTMSSRCKELMEELASVKEELACAYADNERAMHEGSAMIDAKENEAKEMVKVIEKAEDEIDELKCELMNASSLLETTRESLAAAKDSERKMSEIIANTRLDLDKAKLELHRERSEKSEAMALNDSVSKELEDKCKSLKTVEEERDKYAACFEALKSEIEMPDKGKHGKTIGGGAYLDSELRQFRKLIAANRATERESMQKAMAEVEMARYEKAAAEESKQQLLGLLEKAKEKAELANQEAITARADAKKKGDNALSSCAEIQALRDELRAANEATERALLEIEEKKDELRAANLRNEAALEEVELLKEKLQMIKLEKLEEEMGSVPVGESEGSCGQSNCKTLHLELQETREALGDAMVKLEIAKTKNEELTKKLLIEESKPRELPKTENSEKNDSKQISTQKKKKRKGKAFFVRLSAFFVKKKM